MRVIGYVRLSKAALGTADGYGLDAQRQAITAEAARRGVEIVSIESDNGASGKTGTVKLGLERALLALATHQADTLMVAKLDRIARSSLDFAKLLERSRVEGWRIVALDMGLDTSTAVGEVVATVLMAFAAFERRIISERTIASLQVARERGKTLGRPRKRSGMAA
jgi:DNA invertase Pin-like site-specific DNA recombinase